MANFAGLSTLSHFPTGNADLLSPVRCTSIAFSARNLGPGQHDERENATHETIKISNIKFEFPIDNFGQHIGGIGAVQPPACFR